jgi:hypothetical protein
MSKRTTPESKTTPTPRRRATKPAADAVPAEVPAEAPKAPRTRRKATSSEVTVAAEATPTAASPQPSHDEIAIRAYFISIEQGADPLAAWLLAERELTTA